MSDKVGHGLGELFVFVSFGSLSSSMLVTDPPQDGVE